MSYTRAAEHAGRAAELAAAARHHAADDDRVIRALADAVEEIAKAIAELARTHAGES
jgi:methyl-accepting chemotaxis protein